MFFTFFFFLQKSEIKRDFVENQLLILLVYKEAFLNFEETYQPFRSLAIYLLHEFEDVRCRLVCCPHKRYWTLNWFHYLELLFQTDQPKKVILRRQLQRRVKELRSKGNVRESMSPCAVLVLFVLKRMGRGECASVAGDQQHNDKVSSSHN